MTKARAELDVLCPSGFWLVALGRGQNSSGRLGCGPDMRAFGAPRWGARQGLAVRASEDFSLLFGALGTNR